MADLNMYDIEPGDIRYPLGAVVVISLFALLVGFLDHTPVGESFQLAAGGFAFAGLFLWWLHRQNQR